MTDTHHSNAVLVAVLTGLLSAGKSRLLNCILNGDHGRCVAVLVNDFDSINIHADLVGGVEGGGDIISLANSSVCWNIRRATAVNSVLLDYFGRRRCNTKVQ
jgi:G3E family GTPase